MIGKNKMVRLLILGLSFTWASSPMEPSKKSLIVYQHGIGAIENGHVYEDLDEEKFKCDAVTGSGGGSFNTKKNTGYVVGEITNSFHHVYNQSRIQQVSATP